MYESYFRFREKPFHVTADTGFFFPSQEHQEALAHLTYGIRQGLGFILITGEVGMGKTTLAKSLVEQLSPNTKTALILNPSLSGSEFLLKILEDFGLSKEVSRGFTRGQMLHRIESFLLEQARKGSSAVLIIDEAQAVGSPTLELVRLLSNVETLKSKLLQIILVGQPEISQRLLNDKRLRALNERIAVRYQIRPLSKEEVYGYVAHRLKVASGSGQIPSFTEEALGLIAEMSNGIPRRINLICDQALLAAFVHETWEVDQTMVLKAQAAVFYPATAHLQDEESLTRTGSIQGGEK